MFKCEDCGAVFESLGAIRECIGEPEYGPVTYYGCPNCKSDQVVCAFRCDLCGEYVAHDFVILNDGTVACNNCYKLY